MKDIINNKIKNKAQMEIMGLAIVVLLIIIGMFFIVRFVMVKKPAEFKEEYTQTQLASNMINTLLKSNTKECSGMSITELLQDCAQSQSVYCENGQVSCAYVRDTAQYIFSETLEKQNRQYQFLVYFPDESPLIDLGERCIGEKKSKTFPIPTSAGALNIQLDICG